MNNNLDGGLIVALFVGLYLLIGEAVLLYNTKRRYLRPLTDKETLIVILTWWNWL